MSRKREKDKLTSDDSAKSDEGNDWNPCLFFATKKVGTYVDRHRIHKIIGKEIYHKSGN